MSKYFTTGPSSRSRPVGRTHIQLGSIVGLRSTRQAATSFQAKARHVDAPSSSGRGGSVTRASAVDVDFDEAHGVTGAQR